MKEKVSVKGVPETIDIRKRFLEEKGPIYQIDGKRNGCSCIY